MINEIKRGIQLAIKSNKDVALRNKTKLMNAKTESWKVSSFQNGRDRYRDDDENEQHKRSSKNTRNAH